MYWRIIRTNYDGSIRLLYSGTSPDTTSGYIGKSAFNSTYNDPMYVGYKYGTTGSLENNRLNTNDSIIKTYVDNWYKNYLTAYTKYLSNDAVYCNDRNLASGQTVYCNDRELASGSTYSTGSSFNYAPYGRQNANKTPTYNCANIKDAFSGSNSEAKLTYPIGLMTSDEISYAGGESYTDLTAPYAWYYLNSAGGSITGSNAWWSLSPNFWSGSYSFFWFVYGSVNPGNLNHSRVVVSLAVRPSVSLKSCNLISGGDGSANNPYIVKTDGSSCTPTYNCTNNKDAFSGNNSEAKLTYPIGLMTADEVVFAGGVYGSNAKTWYYYNSANGNSAGSTWKLMSPYFWEDSLACMFGVMGSTFPGLLSNGRVGLPSNVRPALSLKACIKYSTGNGTPETPYEIVETDTGC
ncbi:unknown [Clostridium sp. CAG:628]|nr:unknown [Clostridium sp. CAG:628]